MQIEKLDSDFSFHESLLAGTNIDVEYTNNMSWEDLCFISQSATNEPNLGNNPPQLFKDKLNDGALILRNGKTIVGYIFENILPFRDIKISEIGSLWVDDSFRGKKLGLYLSAKILSILEEKPVISITKEAPVQQINRKIMDYEVISPEGDFRTCLEDAGPLSSEYKYYVNSLLGGYLSQNL